MMEDDMAVSYKKLFHLLIEKNMTVFCKYKLPKNAEALPESCSGKFLKVA